MFTKIALVKRALVPLAAAALLAQVASASPAALHHRQGDYPSVEDFYWPPPPKPHCLPDRSHLPKIVKPDGDTVWRVGDWRKVRWEEEWDDRGQDDGDHDGEGGEDRRRLRCKPRLILFKRRDNHFRPLTLGADFDLDDGFIDVHIPNVNPGDDYAVILYLGRLESRSDMFKIRKRRDE